MSEDRTKYQCPLGTRYGKGEMSNIFSEGFKFQTWRECWVALAESEYELNLGGVTKAQVDQLKQYVKNINYDVAEKKEKEVRHDVMSHVYAYGQQCPEAAGIIHLGATSCCITDNAELIQMHKALDLVERKLVSTIKKVRDFSEKYKDQPILAYTHFQSAQPTTLGKRSAGWCQDLIIDLEQVNQLQSTKKLRGLKGATGTQASYLDLANGNEEKVKELNKKFINKFGYDLDFTVTTQTYPRKYDSIVVNALAGIGESAHKAGDDIRMMQNEKEMEEPFEEKQVGSSTMAYKRNPMRSERMCSLSREIIGDSIKPRMTSITQWFERTLDDSAGRRLYIPQAFLATDEVLNLYLNIMEKPVVYPKVMEMNLNEEMPFIATENIMMDAVKNGADRQKVHEAIRQNSQEAARRIKEEGKGNELLQMLADDPRIGMTLEQINDTVDVRKYIGRAPQQVIEFVAYADSILSEKQHLIGEKSKVEV